MFFSSLIVLLVCASGLLWWRLSHVRHENTELRAEVSKLRGRLRMLNS